MSFLLHRDTYAAHLRGIRRVSNRFLQHSAQLHVSAVTVMELELWLLDPKTPFPCSQAYGVMLRHVTVLEVTDAIAHRAAQLGRALLLQGTRMTGLNLLLVATALMHSLTLVTHATHRFANVPGLTIVDWFVP